MGLVFGQEDERPLRADPQDLRALLFQVVNKAGDDAIWVLNIVHRLDFCYRFKDYETARVHGGLEAFRAWLDNKMTRTEMATKA